MVQALLVKYMKEKKDFNCVILVVRRKNKPSKSLKGNNPEPQIAISSIESKECHGEASREKNTFIQIGRSEGRKRIWKKKKIKGENTV